MDRYIDFFPPCYRVFFERCSVIIWPVPYGKVFRLFPDFCYSSDYLQTSIFTPSTSLSIEEIPTGSGKKKYIYNPALCQIPLEGGCPM